MKYINNNRKINLFNDIVGKILIIVFSINQEKMSINIKKIKLKLKK